MNYLGIDKASISNGPGVRVVLWVSGCTLHCKGCQNPESWDFNAGKLFDDYAKQELFEALNKPYIQGITISGGHPLERKNARHIRNLIMEIKDKFPNKDIWLYTGYRLLESDFKPPQFDIIMPNEALWNCDVIVDGQYIEEQRDITLAFRGSKNQRLIDVKETLKQGKIITIQN
jgi:anaerobic ribonucleoside-triphosphate reductase activating protein